MSGVDGPQDPQRFQRRQEWEESPRRGSWQWPTRSSAVAATRFAVGAGGLMVLLAGEWAIVPAALGGAVVQLFTTSSSTSGRARSGASGPAAVRRSRRRVLWATAGWVLGVAVLAVLTVAAWPWSAGVRVPAAIGAGLCGLVTGALTTASHTRLLRSAPDPDPR